MSKLLSIFFMAASFSICFNTFENNNIDHSAWDTLLKKYVSENGNVNYDGFKQESKFFNTYIDYLSKITPSENWSKEEKLAFYINVYNANTIKLITDNYPIKSIKDIKNPWAKKRVKIGDENFSLSYIEHDILRKMNEPRIHFAINCASKSCPKLINMAYTSKNIDALLEQVSKAFINNPEKNNISKEKVQLSKIFDWYKKDFTENGSLIDYINQYSLVKIYSDAKISYLEYDWSLNEQH